MSVDGTWNLRMQTPIGERNSILTLKSSGGALTGTVAADEGTAEIFDGSVVSDMVRWKVSITSPMPLTLEFKGNVSGDQISGEVDSGGFGSWAFDGKRA